MPPEQKWALEMDLFGDQCNLNELSKVFLKTKVQNAGATIESDRVLILDLIAKKEGAYAALNNKVNEFLRSWIRGVIKEIIDARFVNHDDDTDVDDDDDDDDDVMATTTLMTHIAEFLHQNGEPDEAMKLCKKCIAIREAKLGTDHPSTATSYNHFGMILSHKGDYAAALVQCRKALTIKKSLGRKSSGHSEHI
jgi:tetratricopeptide (TPR) repeat protein